MARELLSDRLAQRLIRRIKTGKYVVGDFLPSEPELVQQEGALPQYGASGARRS